MIIEEQTDLDDYEEEELDREYYGRQSANRISQEIEC